MYLKIFLILMIVFAFMAIQTEKLRRAVIYMGIFSLISSFSYLLYSAPDVAIAEAIIGSTLATILYLVALNRYKLFTIYYINDDYAVIDDEHIKKGQEQVLDIMEKFCISKELEAHVIFTKESFSHIQKQHTYDLIVLQSGENVSIYGNKKSYHFDALQECVYRINNERSRIEYVIHKIEEEVSD